MLTFFPIFEEIWLKQLCLWRERRIDSIERVSRKFPLDNVKYVAGSNSLFMILTADSFLEWISK